MPDHALADVPDPYAAQPIVFERTTVEVSVARLTRLEAIERSHAELAETLTGIVACIQTHANDERGLNRRLIEDYLGEAVHRVAAGRRLMKT